LEVEVVKGYGECWEDEVRVDIAEVLPRSKGTVMWRKEAPDSSGHVSSLRIPNIIEINRG